MATTKTLAPTNQTVTIPAMSDAPNASVLAINDSRQTDAINTLTNKRNVLLTTWNVPDFTINARSGKLLSTILSNYSINVPSGQAILANVCIVANGVSGLTINFDGTGAYTSASPAAYIFNTADTQRTISGLNVRVLTLLKEA